MDKQQQQQSSATSKKQQQKQQQQEIEGAMSNIAGEVMAKAAARMLVNRGGQQSWLQQPEQSRGTAHTAKGEPSKDCKTWLVSRAAARGGAVAVSSRVSSSRSTDTADHRQSAP